MKQIKGLNELRGAAALAVAACHIPCFAQPLIAGSGEFAVLLFVMLSAFLSMYSSDQKGQYHLGKRLARVWPLYAVFTLFTYAVAVLKPGFFRTATATPLNLLRSLLFVPYTNLNGMVRPILDVGWTLSVEVLFYVVFALSSRVAFRLRGWLTSGMFVLIYAVGLAAASEHPVFCQYSSTLLAAVCGVILYALWKHLPEKITRRQQKGFERLIPYVLFWAAMACCAAFVHGDWMKVLLAALVFAAFLLKAETRVISKALSFVAACSYSLYLSHQFVVKGFDRLVFSLEKLNVLTAALGLLCIGAAIAVGYAVHRFVERPLGRLTNK